MAELFDKFQKLSWYTWWRRAFGWPGWFMDAEITGQGILQRSQHDDDMLMRCSHDRAHGRRFFLFSFFFLSHRPREKAINEPSTSDMCTPVVKYTHEHTAKKTHQGNKITHTHFFSRFVWFLDYTTTSLLLLANLHPIPDNIRAS